MVRYKCEGVSCSNGEGVKEADYVIVTTSAPVSSLISYNPPLGNQKLHALRKVHYDNSVKIVLVFTTAFWEQNGTFGGKLISDYPGKYIKALYLRSTSAITVLVSIRRS